MRARTRTLWTLDSIRWKLLYLDSRDRDRVGAVIERLAEIPVPPGAARVPGTRRLYRLSCGEIRVLYVVEEERILVVAVETGPRNLPARLRRRRPAADGDAGPKPPVSP